MGLPPDPSLRQKPEPTAGKADMGPGFRQGDGTGVLIGVITGAHGIRGEVKLRSFASVPEDIASYGPLITAGGNMVSIRKLRPQKDGFIAILDGVTDRNAAEALRGTELFVKREQLPAPGEGEVYFGDLIGLPVVRKNGEALGEVTGFENYGASDLLAVQVPGRSDTLLIPFAEAFVTVEAARIVADLPEGYLDEREGRSEEQ